MNFPTEAELERAAARIRSGGLVAFPTETVYGLGANALDAAACERIFAAKQRPKTSPLIVHVASIEAAKALAADWPDPAQRLAECFWPGPLTLVVPKKAVIPDVVTAGLPTVGLRMPAHPVAQRLLELAGVPVAAPSANRFTELSPTAAGHVADSGVADLILEGGPAAVGIESTVLSLAGAQPVLLRPGMVTREQIEALIGRVLTASEPASGTSHASPGQHERHYRPRTPLYLGWTPRAGRGAWLWWNANRTVDVSHRMPADARGYAAKLYGVLHALDREALDWIAVEPVPASTEWDGVRDRLQRATTL